MCDITDAIVDLNYTEMYRYDAIVSNARVKLCCFLHQHEEHVELKKKNDNDHDQDNESLSYK